MTTLLEKAKAAQPKNRKSVGSITEEYVDLVVAYAQGDITGMQVMAALGKTGTRQAAQGVIAMIVIKCIRAGLLVRKTDGAK